MNLNHVLDHGITHASALHGTLMKDTQLVGIYSSHITTAIMAMSNYNSLEMKHFVDVPLMSFGTYEGRGEFNDPALSMKDIPKNFDKTRFEQLKDYIQLNYTIGRKIGLIEGDVQIGYLGRFIP